MFSARCTRHTRRLVLVFVLTAAALGATPLLANATYIVELTGAPAAVTAAAAAAAGGPLSGDEIQALRDELRAGRTSYSSACARRASASSSTPRTSATS